MTDSSLTVETRGGLLVLLVIAGAVGLEVRTALGLYLGVDLPAVPYFAVLVGLLVVAGVALDLRRTMTDTGRETDG